MAEIVAADDDPSMRNLLRRVLSSADHDVRVCDNGETLVREVRAHHPDVVVTDNDMPIMTGLQAVEELRADTETSNIPVVLATGSVPPAHHAAVLDERDRLLIKPYSPDELQSTVSSALDHDSVADGG